VPGDRAKVAGDGSIELLGRDSMTINSGGEKIFVEEVEEAIKTLRKEAGVTASELRGWLDNPTVAPGVASE